MSTFFLIANTAGSVVVALAAAYFFLAAGLGIRYVRRTHVQLGFQSTVSFGHPFDRLPGTRPVDRSEWSLYFLVPCLNEEKVIGRTVAALRDPSGRSRTIVVDDGSDDRTSRVAQDAGGHQTIVVPRTLPEARQGKGAALNSAFAVVLDDVASRGLDPDRVIVCVMDADGRLSDGAVDEVLPLFDAVGVGGVQLAVRIRNRDDGFWLQFQDHQFWTLSALTQFGRVTTGTVSLGGNGQFTRLSALIEVGKAPWVAGALTEDLELALDLGTRGWHLLSTPRAAVDQEGVGKLRALVRQRTRWYQGHMMSARHIPALLRSPQLSHAAAIEMVLYLLVPWLLDLPWSILYHVICLEIALDAWRSGVVTDPSLNLIGTLAGWYLLAFWPALLTALLAKRRDRSASWRRALVLGHCFLVTNYLSYVCTWGALWRIVRRRNGWAKTDRVGDAPADAPPDAAAALAAP